MVEAFFGVGQRQQVMQLVGAAAAPAQVIGHPRRLDTLSELFDLLQVIGIEGMGPADGQGHTVHHQGIALGYRIQVIQGFTALDQVILGDHFEPIHRWRLFKDLLVVLAA